MESTYSRMDEDKIVRVWRSNKPIVGYPRKNEDFICGKSRRKSL